MNPDLDRKDRITGLLRSSLGWTEETCSRLAGDLVRLKRGQAQELAALLNGSEPKGGPFYRLFTDEEIENRETPFLILPPAIQAGSVAALVGPPGAGKTFMGIHWAFSHELGIPWAPGHPTADGHSVYVLAEGGGMLGRRTRAWKDYTGVEGVVGVQFVLQAVNLMDALEVERFIADVTAATEYQPTLIQFDTLSRCLGAFGGDENSQKDMGLFIRGCDRIRDATGAAILIHHHKNASGDRERGSTVLRGNVDTMLELSREGSRTLKLSCVKQKDHPEFPPIYMGLEPHGDSAVITVTSSLSVSGPDMTPDVMETGRLLTTHGLAEGLTSTSWLKISQKNERTFYRHLKVLSERGYIEQDRPGRGARYTLTETGRELLTCQ